MDRKELVIILNQDGFELVYEQTKTRYNSDEILFWKRIYQILSNTQLLFRLDAKGNVIETNPDIHTEDDTLVALLNLVT